MNAAQRRQLSDQLRAAIRDSDLSQNEVARNAGVDKAVLSRFMNGGSMSLQSIEQLAATLNLQLVEKKGKRA